MSTNESASSNPQKNTKQLSKRSSLKLNLITFFVGLTLLIFTLGLVIWQQDQIFVTPEDVYQQKREEIINIISEKGLVENPTAEDVYSGQLKGLVGSYGDPYSEYLPAKEDEAFQDALNQRYQGVGIKFEETSDGVFVDRVFSGSPAAGVDIQPGDKLTAVDGQTASGRTLSELAEKIRGQENTKVTVEFSRANKISSFELVRSKIQTDLIYLEVKDNAAIIEISSFGQNLEGKMEQIASKILQDSSIKFVILDLRGNTGGLLNEAINITSYFVEPNSVVVREKTKEEEFVEYSQFKNQTLKDYPLYVLVDQQTASASEILAGALRDLREVKLVGQATFGKGTVQSLFELQDGSKLRLTVAEWFTPNGTVINDQGLKPDFETTSAQADELALQKLKDVN